MSKRSPSLGLGKENPPPSEAEAIEQIDRTIREQVERDYRLGVRPARRDQHPKAHGCVRATFQVHSDLPENLRHGLFKEPRTFNAWIRFSSSSAQMRSDTKRDAHGMAIKLMGVAGEKLLEEEKHELTHDFVLANNDVFFVRSAADYVTFVSAFTTGRLICFFFNWNPFKWRLHELRNILTATQKKVTNPLQIRYWSQTPYKLGSNAVKYSAKPCSPALDPMPASPTPNFLRAAMAQQLQCGPVTFDFMVQLQTDPEKMPVEDSTIGWSETLSPFQRVATIHIPKQVFDSPAQLEFAENLSFTPWHALECHRPIGNTNRIRRKVYETISKLRHEMNHAPRSEPTGDEVF
jgi:hypothetical protein